jgi:hypothetical protein
MPVTSSGAISIQNIMTELGISGSTSLNDADVRGLIGKAAGAQMSMTEWYGAQDAFSFNVSTGIDGASTLSTLATAAGWDGTVPIIMTVDSGVHIRSMSSSTPSLTIDVADSVLINSGAIFGRGGNSNSGAGGHAISITAAGTTVTNNFGAFIAGGGGGGSGAGGGGGAGQSAYNTASSNGATTGYITFAGGTTPNVTFSGCTISGAVVGGTGGPQGGGGVTGSSYITGGCSSPSYFVNGGGYAGERYQEGGGYVNNSPALGGSVLSATSNTDGAGSNGGGGWGRSGESGGGAAGYAINTSLSYTYTNNGNVYGSV